MIIPFSVKPLSWKTSHKPHPDLCHTHYTPGAYSYYGGYNYKTVRDVSAGDELFTSYGKHTIMSFDDLCECFHPTASSYSRRKVAR